MSASLRLRLSLHPEQVAAERAYPDDLGDSVTVRYHNHATGSGRETVHGLQRGSKRLRAQQDVRPSRYPDALQSVLLSESGRRSPPTASIRKEAESFARLPPAVPTEVSMRRIGALGCLSWSCRVGYAVRPEEE